MAFLGYFQTLEDFEKEKRLNQSTRHFRQQKKESPKPSKKAKKGNLTAICTKENPVLNRHYIQDLLIEDNSPKTNAKMNPE